MRVFLLLFLFTFSFGCSGELGKPANKKEAEGTSNLRELGEMLRLVGKPVSKASELVSFKGQFEDTFQLVDKGEIIVVWGARMPNEGSPGTADIVAYLKKVPTEGGLVLLLNGTIKQMSASEFVSANKAK